MTKVFVTSDLHFGHTNVIEFCPETRGMFSSAEEMNEGMIEAWNKEVSNDDTVYIFGDLLDQVVGHVGLPRRCVAAV